MPGRLALGTTDWVTFDYRLQADERFSRNLSRTPEALPRFQPSAFVYAIRASAPPRPPRHAIDHGEPTSVAQHVKSLHAEVRVRPQLADLRFRVVRRPKRFNPE